MDEIHDTLDQHFFDGIDPRPNKIKFIRDHFYNGIKDLVPNPEDYLSLFLTGSLATYQYSDNSDCDISIFPDYDKLPEVMGLPDANAVRKALIQVVINKLDGIIVPGTSHPIQHFVVLVDNTPQELYKPGIRSAWSFQTESWFVPPEKDRVHNVKQELPIIYLRAHAIADKMRVALDTDPKAAIRLFQRIHIKRTQDQRAGRGDFSEGNIVYKYLLHEGLFDRLKAIGVYIAKTGQQNSEVNYRWGYYNGHILVQNCDDQNGGDWCTMVHYEMAEELLPNTDLLVGDDGRGGSDERQMNVEGFYVGYAWLDTSNNKVHFKGDSYDLGQKEIPAFVENEVAEEIVDDWHRKYAKTAGTPVGFDDWTCPKCGEHDVYEDPEGGFECRKCGMAIVSKVADDGFSLKQTYADQYKYSFDGQNLEVWKVNMATGDPHHFEHIGPNHAQNAEGRIYAYGPNDIFNMVWTERGTPALRQRAQRLVAQWCLENLGNRPTYTGEEQLLGLDKEGAEAPTQIIYDFNKDRIILGTKAEAAALPSSVIVGMYHDGHATMFEVAHQWLNTAYFKKLWLHSFPTWPLKGISVQGPNGHERVAASPTAPTPQEYTVRYIQAFIYFDPPIDGLLTEPMATEHSELVENWIDQIVENSPEYAPEEASQEGWKLIGESPKTAGHVGEYLTIGNEFQAVAVFYSDFLGGRLDQSLKNHALAALRKHWPNIIEGPQWVYDYKWYQGA